jgi:predicted house-cleaning noncanonical NTP pyrophosphatase (MazG superfamily)
MNERLIFSDEVPRINWSDASTLKVRFGPKASTLTTLPRYWTPPFAILACDVCNEEGVGLTNEEIRKIEKIAALSGKLYVRSSVVGETIWERGTYHSIVISVTDQPFHKELARALTEVRKSAAGQPLGFVLQSYIEPKARGEFGNLLRISKTRDHWELSTNTNEVTARTRINTQRDEAANASAPIEIGSRLARERQFGSIAAWINTYLLAGNPIRVNCEWVADLKRLYLVQIDEEDEDLTGLNPFQMRVPPAHQPAESHGKYLRCADESAIEQWDKLKVLKELWEPSQPKKPTLFYAPVELIARAVDNSDVGTLEKDFSSLIGPNNIVVRTSGLASAEKKNNLDRTEGLTPSEAARWCVSKYKKFRAEHGDVSELAFVAHRFIAARAAAWVRADPNDPIVEINSLWGLPDALQYCPYDIWEVHIPTQNVTEYPDYKSHILMATEDGGWQYKRIKNELGRSLSIGTKEALDLANRTAAIAQQMDRACHIMWFVGCVDEGGELFNVPWYWTNAHETERNTDRSNYQVFIVEKLEDLSRLKELPGSRARQAIELRPTDQNLMRDLKFISSVGTTAKELNIPVILAGSTLAHAYFQLDRQGCSVVAKGEKEHSRIRKNTTFGKIVRDKIPKKIADRKETEVTKKIPSSLRKNFLTSKLLEEALEVRQAQTIDEKRMELADLYEVVRALSNNEGISIEEVAKAAESKRNKAGGFDEGLVLLQTGIAGRAKKRTKKSESQLTQVLARKVNSTTIELPFTFFGFMELDQPRTIEFENFETRLNVTLRNDRIEISLSRDPHQLFLPLDLEMQDERR